MIIGTSGTAAKISRNGLCPCGSGRKTKACHLLAPTLPPDVPVLIGGRCQSLVTAQSGFRAVVFDAGAGDAIHAMRFVRDLAKEPEPTIFIVRPSMRALFGLSFPEVTTYSHTPLPPIARQVTSLMLIQNQGGERAPYLRVPKKAKPSPRRWGLCARGDRTQAFDPWRSILDEAVLAPLLRANPVRLEKTGGDWLETAQEIAQCEFVVSVDTGVAHLAGALGIPLILLDRAPDPRGRQLDPGPDDRWDIGLLQKGQLYAGGVTRLRQVTRGDWAPVIRVAVREVVRRL